MNKLKGLVVVLLCVISLLVSAQKKKKASKSKATSTSVEPYYPSKVYSPKASKKKKSSETTYDARDKYYDRVEMLGKKRRKNEKNADTPQYSEFQFFGHKKPPKRRPPEKMKYCKVCGIRH